MWSKHEISLLFKIHELYSVLLVDCKVNQWEVWDHVWGSIFMPDWFSMAPNIISVAQPKFLTCSNLGFFIVQQQATVASKTVSSGVTASQQLGAVAGSQQQEATISYEMQFNN